MLGVLTPRALLGSSSSGTMCSQRAERSWSTGIDTERMMRSAL